MTNQEIINTGQQIATEQHIGGNTAARVGGVVEGIGVALNNKDAANGYYEARMSGGSIIVTAPNYVLGTGGNLRLKMPAAGTAASTLTIGNASQVPLLYNGAAVSSRNGWDAGEIIDVFYDGQNFLASNSEGGGDIKVENNSTGADLDINDDSNNTLVRFSDGHVKTKNFDSRNLKAFVGDADSTDLDFADEQDKVVLRVAGGHVKTKEFDSSLVGLTTVVSNNSDLDFSDINGKVLARFRNGHIQTKNFNSADLESIVSGMYQTILAMNHPLRGKKVGFLGDSITYGYGLTDRTKRYSTVLSTMIGCTEVNMGVSGTTIASNTLNGLNDQRFVTRVTQENIGNLDFLFVFGGTNDFSYDTKPIGEHFAMKTITPPSNLIGSTQIGAIEDTDTFAGGLHDLILAIRAISPNLPMCFITPLNRGRYLNGSTYTYGGVTYRGARPNTADSNSRGNYLHEFTDAIIDITRFYGIPSIDMGSLFDNNPTDNGDSNLFQANGDNLHPNVAGNARLAKLLFNWTMYNL